MGILQKKCRTTRRMALAYRGKGGQNTGTAFLALSEEDTRDPTKKETWHFGIAILKNDVKHVRAYSQNPKRTSGWDVAWLANILKEADARPFVAVCSREKV